MARHISALHLDATHLQHVIVVELHHLQVAHIVYREAHDRAVGLGLPQQLAPLGVHADRQVVVLAALAQPRYVVHVGVGEQYVRHRQPLLLYILRQLHVLERRLRCGVNDGALPRHCVDDDVAVDLKMVELELLYHCLWFLFSLKTQLAYKYCLRH